MGVPLHPGLRASLGGDLNCPLNPEIDKQGGIVIQRKSVTACIDCLQNQLDLVDNWRIKSQTQEVLPGVKGLQEFFAISIIG